MVTCLIAIICFGCFDIAAAKSALLGGIVCWFPNLYFAKKLFQYRGASNAKHIARSFYQGQAIKVLMAFALFSLVFSLCGVKPMIFFGVYITVQLVLWFAPLLIQDKALK